MSRFEASLFSLNRHTSRGQRTGCLGGGGGEGGEGGGSGGGRGGGGGGAAETAVAFAGKPRVRTRTPRRRVAAAGEERRSRLSLRRVCTTKPSGVRMRASAVRAPGVRWETPSGRETPPEETPPEETPPEETPPEV